jgi:aspartyl-tRNA(Asn)/glutamyl-tRNA(Gln) amidotransferase subunit C
MGISKDEIKHIADLARLELSSDELKKYGNQLEQILGYVDQLQKVDIKNIEPTAQVTGLLNVIREDRPTDWDRKEIETSLSQAPETESGQIKVKRVLE